MTLEEQLEKIGIAARPTIERFGGCEEMLLRFLKMFTEDPTMRQLCEAVESRDAPAIERSAHTLKGITANLGMKSLCGLCQSMVEKIRAGQTGGLEALFAEIRREYEEMIGGILLLPQEILKGR